MREKRFAGIVLVLLMATLIIAAVPTESEAAIYDDTVRLHIRAESDSDEDQAVKLEIRDRLLEKYSAAFTACDVKAAERELCSRIGEIECDVNGWLDELGCGYACKAEVRREWFDTRDYGEYSLPAGEYTALVIELGSGEGANWWCVMFPPMCLDIAEGEPVRYTDAENGLIAGGRYRIKFKLLELAAELAK